MKDTDTNSFAFTVEEFIEAYRVNRNRVYAEIHAGRLRARKLGRRTMIARADAAAWFAALPDYNHAA